MPVGGDLRPVRQPALEVHQEPPAIFGVARADEPAGHQLGIGADRGPRPHVADAELALAVLGNVLGLRVYEGPDLVALDRRAGKVVEHLVLVGGEASPMSSRSFCTVLIATPAMRLVARTLLPSTSIESTWARFSVDNLFILTIMPERSRKCKHILDPCLHYACLRLQCKHLRPAKA